MLKLFQKSSLRGEGSPDGIALAEQALLAEALLQTSAQLIGRPDPAGMARRYCEAIVSASPNICMAWVWFGDPNATVVEPQVAVGPAILAEKRLSIGADFFASPRSMAVLTTSGVPTRTFDLSPTATHGPWRAAASRYGARSVLIAPISSGGDERGLLAVYSTRARYFESTSAGLFQTVAQLLHAVLASSRQQADRLPDEASDLVTGLANRRHARRTLEEQWNLESEHATRGVLAIVALAGWSAISRCATWRKPCWAMYGAPTWCHAGEETSSCCGSLAWPRATRAQLPRNCAQQSPRSPSRPIRRPASTCMRRSRLHQRLRASHSCPSSTASIAHCTAPNRADATA